MIVRRIAWNLAAAAFLLALLEGGVRLWIGTAKGGGGGAAEEACLAFDDEVGWQRRPGTRCEAFGAVRSFDSRGLLDVDSGQAGSGQVGSRELLVLVLGDSRTYGNGVETGELFSEVLDGLLPGRSVVNLGVPGHSAWQGARMLERWGPELRPEVAVLAYGFNGRRYVLDPRDADGPEAFERLAASRRLAWLGRLALVRLLGGGPGSGGANRGEPGLDLGGVAPRLDLATYRESLERAVEVCHRLGIRPVLLLLRDNPRETAALREGIALAREGRHAEARERLQEAVGSGNVFADAARLALADSYRAEGLDQQAHKTLRSPRRLASSSGGYPLLPEDPYLTAAREVAAEHGATVVDAGPWLDRHPQQFFDFCHFKAEAHRAVAELLRERIHGVERHDAASRELNGPRKSTSHARNSQEKKVELGRARTTSQPSFGL